MAIAIEHVGNHFTIEVTPPDGPASSLHALTPTEVMEKLGALGCHSTDITDALDASGADWRPVHDAEVLRRRNQST